MLIQIKCTDHPLHPSLCGPAIWALVRGTFSAWLCMYRFVQAEGTVREREGADFRDLESSTGASQHWLRCWAGSSWGLPLWGHMAGSPSHRRPATFRHGPVSVGHLSPA